MSKKSFQLARSSQSFSRLIRLQRVGISRSWRVVIGAFIRLPHCTLHARNCLILSTFPSVFGVSLRDPAASHKLPDPVKATKTKTQNCLAFDERKGRPRRVYGVENPQRSTQRNKNKR